MSGSSELVRQADRARERSEIERRRTMVARLRWLEDSLTAAEIAAALQRLDPPIVVSIRTVERDFIAIRDQAHRYLSAHGFDARLEVGTALARYELLARLATRYAISEKGNGSRWARAALRATEAKMQLLQDIGLIDRRLGVLFIDDGQAVEKIPSGEAMQRRFAELQISEGELVSEAERHYRYGDAAAAEAAAEGKPEPD